MGEPQRDDATVLADLIEVWKGAADDFVALLRDLDEGDWSRSTDLPGWDVHAVAAHVAHLESELAGRPQPETEVAPEALEADHVRGPMGQFTERGPVSRRGMSGEELAAEIEASVEARYAAMRAEPPTDASAPGPGFAGAIGWTWRTLLSNRPLDIWMHEQDIRRAVGRSGGLDTPAAQHVARVFAASLPYVLGKRVKAQPGSTVVVEVTGAVPHVVAAAVGEDGRGRALDAPPPHPSARVIVDFETWTLLSGGRGPVADLVQRAQVDGDPDLGRHVLEAAAVTP